MNGVGVPEWSGARVLIVGDVMLDRFVYGAVTRISPEAPIPILRRAETRVAPGGAANVAANISALGGLAILVGVVGDDEAGADLVRLCQERNVETALIRAARPTTEKIRFVGAGQQLLRVDNEVTGPEGLDKAAIALLVIDRMKNADVVVLSDYAKGVCTPCVLASVIEEARRLGKPTIADPKSSDLAVYRGVTILTPNRHETALATGIDPSDDIEAARAGARAASLAAANAVLVTRGAAGMTLVCEGEATHLRSEAQEVFDVSGAGDSVVAALALAIASGITLEEASRLANVAAGIVVSKQGTASVTRAELVTRLGLCDGSAPSVSALDDAASVVSKWRANGFRIGFTNGCFDLLHGGHLSLLAQARAACDRLVVGVNSDVSVRGLKGPGRPVQSQEVREAVLASLRTVDLVLRFEEPTPERVIKALRPDVLVKGADYALCDVVGAPFVTSYGGRVLLVDLVKGQSTTSTLERLVSRDTNF